MDPATRRKPGTMLNLAVVTAMYTGCTLSKGPVRVSNWEARPLGEAQLECMCLLSYFRQVEAKLRLMVDVDAANDAHCAVTAYHRLLDMAAQAHIRPDPSKYTKGVTKPTPLGVSSAKRAPVITSIPIQRARSAPSSTSISHAATTITTAETTSSDSPSFRVRLKAVSSEATVVSISDSDISDSDLECLDPPLPPPISRTSSSSSSSLSAPRPSSKPLSTSANINVYCTTHKAVSASASAVPTATRLDTAGDAGFRPIHQRPQHIRAYTLWHVRRLPLSDLCAALRSADNPLKRTTVM